MGSTEWPLTRRCAIANTCDGGCERFPFGKVTHPGSALWQLEEMAERTVAEYGPESIGIAGFRSEAPLMSPQMSPQKHAVWPLFRRYGNPSRRYQGSFTASKEGE